MSRTARRAPALLPSGRRLNWPVRSADDHEAAIRWLSGGCHITLTVGKFTSGTVGHAAIDGHSRARSKEADLRIGVQQSGASICRYARLVDRTSSQHRRHPILLLVAVHTGRIRASKHAWPAFHSGSELAGTIAIANFVCDATLVIGFAFVTIPTSGASTMLGRVNLKSLRKNAAIRSGHFPGIWQSAGNRSCQWFMCLLIDSA